MFNKGCNHQASHPPVMSFPGPPKPSDETFKADSLLDDLLVVGSPRAFHAGQNPL